jgi:hypothetical protein
MSADKRRELIELSKALLNSISRARNGSSHAFNVSAHEDTIEMLDALNGAAGRLDFDT